MEKNIRKAVRCFAIKNDDIVCIQYKQNKEGYYDLPGGKIEENETEVETAVRECKEETGLTIHNPEYRGKIIVNYPDRIYDFSAYISTDYSGEITCNDENDAYIMNIDDLLLEKNKFTCTIMLEKQFRKILLDTTKIFHLVVDVNNNENIEKFEMQTKNK